MNSCITICHSDAGCEACSSFIENVSDAAGSAAIILDHYQAQDTIFQAFPAIECNFMRLTNELHDVKGDYHIAVNKLDSAKKAVDDLRGQVSRLERKLKSMSHTSTTMTTPRKRARNNSTGTCGRPIPIDDEEEDLEEIEFYSNDYDNQEARVYTPSRPPPDALPMTYAEAAAAAPAVVHATSWGGPAIRLDLRTKNRHMGNQPWPFYEKGYDPTVSDSVSLVPRRGIIPVSWMTPTRVNGCGCKPQSLSPLMIRGFI